jgi:trigger factor
MKVTNNKTESRTTFLTVEMEQSELEEYLENSYKRMVNRVDIPGFRKGNAPREVLEQHVGRDKLLEDARNELMPKTCAQVIKEQKLDALSHPMVKVTQEEPLVFEMVVPLKPIVKLGDYHSIRIKPETVEVTDKDVDAILDQMRRQRATSEPVERPVKKGDSLTIDIEGIVLESPFIRMKGVRYQAVPEFPPEIPGLSTHFIGMKKGEEKEFKLKLPESYPNKLVAGKEASFKVKVLDIKEETLPELNDDFANKVAPGVKTLDMLKKRIEYNMKAEREEKAKIDFEEKIVETLIEKSKIEFPPVILERLTNSLINESLQQLQMSCKNQQEYEEKLKQLSPDKIKEQSRLIAQRKILWHLVLDEVAKAEKIEVSDAEIDEEIENMIADVDDKDKEEQRQYMNSWENRENIKDLISARKTIHLLTEIAKGSDKKPKKKRKEAK